MFKTRGDMMLDISNYSMILYYILKIGISLSEVGSTNFGQGLCFLLQDLAIGTGFQRGNPGQVWEQKAKSGLSHRKELEIPKDPDIQDIARYLWLFWDVLQKFGTNEDKLTQNVFAKTQFIDKIGYPFLRLDCMVYTGFQDAHLRIPEPISDPAPAPDPYVEE